MKNRDDNVIDILMSARRVADFAAEDGIEIKLDTTRSCYNHLGAVLADSVLQAGLNYASVVRPRIVRILSDFSHADTIDVLVSIVDSGSASRFLDWQHPTKIARFEELVLSVNKVGIKGVDDLRHRLRDDCFCDYLLEINGIGPKTIDYMACLVGIESVAVDRHVRSYAKRAGVEITDYHFLKRVFCFAADLLEVSRRQFDAWIWQRESREHARQANENQPSKSSVERRMDPAMSAGSAMVASI